MLNTLFIRETLETMGVLTPTRCLWRASRMNAHRNAETNVNRRQMLIHRVRRQGWTQRQAPELAGAYVRAVAKGRARAAAPPDPCTAPPPREPPAPHHPPESALPR